MFFYLAKALWFVLLLVGAWAQSWKAHCAVDRQSELHK
jgi:hypothetical protein